MLRARVLRRARLDRVSSRTLVPQSASERLQAAWLRTESLARRSRLMQVLLVCLSIALTLLVVSSIWGRADGARQLRDSRAVAESQRALAVPVETDGMNDALWHSQSVDSRLLWLESENDLTRLRALWDERGKVELRRRLRKVGGADARTRTRIEALASEVAADVLLRASSGQRVDDYDDVAGLALGVRALLGSGSTRLRGPQQAAVRRGLSFLERRLSLLQGPALATALVPCLEAALVAGDARVFSTEGKLGVVGREIRRLVAEELDAFEAARPSPIYPERDVPLDQVFRDREAFACERPDESVRAHLQSWLGRMDTPNGAIGDAGLLLRVAPALGSPPGDVRRLRAHLHRVLRERSYASGPAGASARAALLVAFAEGKQRTALRRSLHGYRIHPDRFGRDVRALLDLAWGVFPGSGWARFNQALRYVIANYDEETPRERAGLLLVQLLWTGPAPLD